MIITRDVCATGLIPAIIIIYLYPPAIFSGEFGRISQNINKVAFNLNHLNLQFV